MATSDFQQVHQRSFQPLPQQPTAHGRRRVVQNSQQAAAFASFAHVAGNFQISQRSRVQHQGILQPEPRQPVHMG